MRKRLVSSAMCRADSLNNDTFAINIKTLIRGLTPSSLEVENMNILCEYRMNRFCYSAQTLFVLRLTLTEVKTMQVISDLK